MGECAPIAVEGATVVRVVQIDREVVGETEHDAPQGVACPTLLDDAHLTRTEAFSGDLLGIQGIARTAVDDRIAVTGEIGRVAAMMHHIGLDNVEGYTPLWVHLHIAEGTVEQRGLRGHGSTADAHIEHGITTDGPQLLGSDIHHHPTLMLTRMFDLPATAFHIHGQLMTLIGISGQRQTALQGAIDIVVGARGLKESHPVVANQCLQGLIIVRCLDLIVEQSGEGRTVGFVVQAVQQLIGRHEAITLADDIAGVGFREMIVKTGQHLVDAHT